ncbi:MAG: ATP-binding cassette domain-containing protein [Bradyrhizobium sp.]|nr:ATP-binding cassette domain-containing protein [Bradyrhizobium sp.]
MAEASIRIRNVSKTYRPDKLLPLSKEMPRPAGGPKEAPRALTDVSFDIRAGQSVGIVGESGCGKTSLAKIIVRMLEPDRGEGSVTFLADDRKWQWGAMSAPERRRLRSRVQYVFQHPGDVLSPRMQAGQIVAEGFAAQLTLRRGRWWGLRQAMRDLRGRALHGHGAPDEIIEMMKSDFELNAAEASSFVRELSGGQAKRVLLAQALAAMGKLGNGSILRAARDLLAKSARARRPAARLLGGIDPDFVRVALREELQDLLARAGRLLASDHGILVLPTDSLHDLASGGEAWPPGQDWLRQVEEAIAHQAEEFEGLGAIDDTDIGLTDEEIAQLLGDRIRDPGAPLPAIPPARLRTALATARANFIAELREARFPLVSPHGLFELQWEDFSPLALNLAPAPAGSGTEAQFAGRLAERIEGPLPDDLEAMLSARIEEIEQAVAQTAGGRTRDYPFPKVLILDEPMRGIDSVNKLKIVRGLQAIREVVTLVVITHDIRILAPLCDRIVVMYDGRIQEVVARRSLPLSAGQPPDGLSDIHPYTAALLSGNIGGGGGIAEAEIPRVEGCRFRGLCPRFRDERAPEDLRQRCLRRAPPLACVEGPDGAPHHIRCWAYVEDEAPHAQLTD